MFQGGKPSGRLARSALRGVMLVACRSLATGRPTAVGPIFRELAVDAGANTLVGGTTHDRADLSFQGSANAVAHDLARRRHFKRLRLPDPQQAECTMRGRVAALAGVATRTEQRLQLCLGILALRTPVRSPNLNRSTFQEALADFPRLTFRLEADLDLRSDGLTVRRIATRKPVGGVVPDEEGGAHRFQQRRLAGFVGLDDDVQPIGQPVEHEGVAVFAKV